MTDALKEIYSSNKNVRVYEALILSHPNFSKIWYLVNDNSGHSFAPYPGHTSVYFEPLPFKIKLPDVGETQQELEVGLPNIGTTISDELDAAIANPEIPIDVKFRIYIEGSADPQASIDDLRFVAVTIDSYVIQATAQRTDLFRRYVLENTMYDWRFEGLWL